MRTNVEGLTKDPATGAVILAPGYKKENFQLDLLQRKITAVYAQNKQIIELLQAVLSAVNPETHK